MRPCFASFHLAAARLAAARLAAAGLAALALGACGGGDPDAPAADAQVDAPTDAGPDGGFVPPTMLSETGLYSDIGNGVIAQGVVEFQPRWELWSDRAVKRRWVWLPPGSQIDTANMDWWQFPVGTKFWKEFVRDGERIETRYIERVGADPVVQSWYFVSFQWNPTQQDALAVPGGVVDDKGNNDIPDRAKCRQCHEPTRNPSVVLGFAALQLDYDAPQGGLDLGRLVAEGRLTVPPPGGSGAYFPMPEVGAGDPTLPALGYVHANCGGCHNQLSSVKNTVAVELRLSTRPDERVSWESTRVWSYTVGPAGTGVPVELSGAGSHIVRPMDLGSSALYVRMSLVTGLQMPPTGRETTDPDGLGLVRAWIESLPLP